MKGVVSVVFKDRKSCKEFIEKLFEMGQDFEVVARINNVSVNFHNIATCIDVLRLLDSAKIDFLDVVLNNSKELLFKIPQIDGVSIVTINFDKKIVIISTNKPQALSEFFESF